jgi:phospholipase/carboxylesterase
VAQGEHDTVIPRELLDRTWDYLLGPSGAPALARRDPVGHTIAAPALAMLAGWVRERLAFLAHRGAPTPGPRTWSALPGGRLPERTGPRPSVSSTIPQEQRSDTAPVELQEQLYARIAALPGVTSRQSAISVPGAGLHARQPGSARTTRSSCPRRAVRPPPPRPRRIAARRAATRARR